MHTLSTQMGTIETLHANISSKIDVLRRIIRKNEHLAQLNNSLHAIQNTFEAKSTNVMSKFDIHGENRRQNRRIFIELVTNENILNRLNYILSMIVSNPITDKNEAKRMQRKYASYCVDMRIHQIDPNIRCPECDVKMNVNSTLSILSCATCGGTQVLNGIMFEDDQSCSQEGHRAKSGSYNVTMHGRIWLERIQGRESTNIPASIIQRVKSSFAKLNIRNLSALTCDQIRDCLKIQNLASYYGHTPLIRKNITGISPPQLTDKENYITLMYLRIVIDIFDRIKPPEKTNCPYHPFFIYKIFEQTIDKKYDDLSDSDDDDVRHKPTKLPAFSARKKMLLSCIHLQSTETLIQNDLMFKKICREIPEFIYIPTRRYR